MIPRATAVALLLLSNLDLSFTEDQTSPLCVHCTCRIQENKTVNVDCANKVIFANFYYDKTTWLDGNGNPFPFGKVTLRGCDLGDLINQFYPSNLTELDLSDNFIRNINSSYFANLQNMVVLDLSRNNIETLKPGVFKVILPFKFFMFF